MPHDAAERVCPTTGRRIEPPAAATGARSRMSELPPPERRPEPLGFDPTKNRIAERERVSELQRPATGTLQPTRNLQTDLIGRTVSDRYLVKGVLGEGGMGTVYEAEHLGLGRAVAIKVLNPSQAKKRVAVKRFQQEARAAGAIGHPNICEVYDLGLLDDGSPYLIMEKLIGTTLADRISREGGLPFDELADVMIQVLSGLIAAHDKGIVHRDIKPENIFLARRVGCAPIVKILDFGVSKMMPQFQGGDEQLDLTRTGMVMGTPYYMSPEQARGERNLDGRVDVYACGVMMYEAIVGKRPFLAPNYNALLLSIINTTPRPIRELRPATPPALDAIVQRSMAKARDDRYPSANAVLRDIQALPIAAAAQANRVPSPPTPEERMRAPVLGGRPPQSHGPSREREHDEAAARSTRGGGRPGRMPEGANASASATLRSRMADAQQPGRDNATRLDIKVKDVRDARREARGPSKDDSGSIEIPIHITGSDLVPVQSGGGPGEYVDEMPTEIFRPGMHPYPPPAHMAARSPSATRVAAAPQPGARRAAPAPARSSRGADAQPPSHHAAQPVAAPAAMAPVDLTGLVGDDWDGETVVKKPAALTTSRHRERPARDVPSSRQTRDPRHARDVRDPREPGRAVPAHGQKPFNPDETINLNGDIDVEIDFGDETQHIAPPPRRPR
jgi:serine/threonine protein kinase